MGRHLRMDDSATRRLHGRYSNTGSSWVTFTTLDVSSSKTDTSTATRCRVRLSIQSRLNCLRLARLCMRRGDAQARKAFPPQRPQYRHCREPRQLLTLTAITVMTVEGARQHCVLRRCGHLVAFNTK